MGPKSKNIGVSLFFFSRPLRGLEGSFSPVAWGGTWSMVSQDAVSGPQAKMTVWERSLQESQVAKARLPLTAGGHRGQTRWGLGRTCTLAPSGHPSLGTKAAESEAASPSSGWMPTGPLLWGNASLLLPCHTGEPLVPADHCWPSKASHWAGTTHPAGTGTLLTPVLTDLSYF